MSFGQDLSINGEGDNEKDIVYLGKDNETPFNLSDMSIISNNSLSIIQNDLIEIFKTQDSNILKNNIPLEISNTIKVIKSNK
jgi:hypothetical protein